MNLNVKQIGVATTMPLIQKMNHEDFADIMEQCTLGECQDIGVALIYKALHPIYGNVVLISSIGQENALVIQ